MQQPSTLDHRSPTEVDLDTAEQRRTAIEQDRRRFAAMRPEAEQLLIVFRASNFSLGISTLDNALRSGSGAHLDAALQDMRRYEEQQRIFAQTAAVAPAPRLSRLAGLDEATTALQAAQAALRAFEAEPYGLADIDHRVVRELQLTGRIRQLERLVTQLQGAVL